jgi:hypothetical protein
VGRYSWTSQDLNPYSQKTIDRIPWDIEVDCDMAVIIRLKIDGLIYEALQHNQCNAIFTRQNLEISISRALDFPWSFQSLQVIKHMITTVTY